MYRLFYTTQAKNDLLHIKTYIAQQTGSLKLGSDFTKRIRLKCKELASIQGTIGVARPEIIQGIRSHPFGNYVIFFIYENDAFKVITIIEARRDIKTIFKNKRIIS